LLQESGGEKSKNEAGSGSGGVAVRDTLPVEFYVMFIFDCLILIITGR
jgi:hypothetical protein